MKKFAILALTALSLTLPAHALEAGPLTAQVDGRLHVWPVIGTDAYSASCSLTGAWEDHSATAYCTEDGATFHYDPDGDITTGKEAGWYVME